MDTTEEPTTVLEALRLVPGLNVLLSGAYSDHRSVALTVAVDAARAGLRPVVLARHGRHETCVHELVAVALGVSEFQASGMEEEAVRLAEPSLAELTPISYASVADAVDAVGRAIRDGSRLVVLIGAIPEDGDEDARRLAAALNAAGEAADVAVLAAVAAAEPDRPKPPRLGEWLPAWLRRVPRALVAHQTRILSDRHASRWAVRPLDSETGERDGETVVLRRDDTERGVTLVGKSAADASAPVDPGTEREGRLLASDDRRAYEEMLRRLS